MICTARRGFLTLSDCGEPAATSCANCGQPVCAAHLSSRSGFTNCLECSATAAPAAEGEEPYDDVWAHRYRDDYYRTSGYTPLYGTAAGVTAYAAHDAAGFDGRPDDFAEEESEGAGFGDS